MFQKCAYRLFHKISIIETYINFIQQDIQKEAKKWVTLKNIEGVGKLAQRKEELEKEIRENNQFIYERNSSN